MGGCRANHQYCMVHGIANAVWFFGVWLTYAVYGSKHREHLAHCTQHMELRTEQVDRRAAFQLLCMLGNKVSKHERCWHICRDVDRERQLFGGDDVVPRPVRCVGIGILLCAHVSKIRQQHGVPASTTIKQPPMLQTADAADAAAVIALTWTSLIHRRPKICLSM